MALVGTLVQNLYFIQLTLNTFKMILNESWTWKTEWQRFIDLEECKVAVLGNSHLTDLHCQPRACSSAQQRSRSKKIRSKDQRNKGTRSYPSWRVTLAFNYQSICLREAVILFLLRITPKSVTPAPLGTIRSQNVTFRQGVLFLGRKKFFFYWKFRTPP